MIKVAIPIFFAVKNQGEKQQHSVYDHIQRSEADGNDRVKTAHQRLKRVDAERSKLKHSDADAAERNAEYAHQNSFD